MIPDAPEASRNTLEWLWDGLPAATRVVASALATADPDPITQDELEHLLRESGWWVRPAAFLWWLVDEAGWLAAGASELIQSAARS